MSNSKNKMQKIHVSKRNLAFISLGLTIGVLLSISLFLFSRPYLSSSYASCEKSISNSQKIRITAHREQSRLLGKGSRVFVYWVSIDKGITWKEFMKFYPDEPPSAPSCETIRILDMQNFWVWEGWQLGVTHDGGKTWHLWEPKNTWQDWKCCNFGLITDVQFDNPSIGVMILDIKGYDQSFTTVQTKDGGKSWK